MLSTDLVVYRPLANGRCSATVVNSGVVQNVFPHVTSAQRATGKTDDAKTFWGLKNTDNLALIDPELYHDAPTNSLDDFVVLWLSTQRTAVADLATEMATADLYGTAVLASDITAGDSTLTVTVKHADLLPGGTYDIFKNGYEIKVCSHSTATATDGDEELRTITGTPTYSGLDVTITVTESFLADYTADGVSRVSSCIRPDDTETSVSDTTITSTAGTVDDTNYPIELDNQGTVDQDWTATFTDATHYTLSGDTLGVVGSGVVGTDFSPVNPDFTRVYLTIPADFFTGTWAASDTYDFTTNPARVPVGQRRVVPAGAASLANNKCTQVFGGEAVG